MLIWDNKQATNWFVGILEGEGSFYLRDSGSRRVVIPNNDFEIIKRCQDFLTKNNLLSTIWEVKAGIKKGYKLSISLQECNNLYTRILPYMDCRRKEFQKIMGASETTRDISISPEWLIGIWEAEGSIFISQNYRGHLTPRLELDNTNDLIIKKIVLTLKHLNLSWHIKRYFPDKRQPYSKISISGFLRCYRFLQKFENQWQSSRNTKRSNLVLEFLKDRLTRTKNEPYSDRHMQIYHEMKVLNG